jgi:hypothetical protein
MHSTALQQNTMPFLLPVLNHTACANCRNVLPHLAGWCGWRHEERRSVLACAAGHS